MYKLQQGYCEYVSYDAWRRNLYTIPKPDNRTMAQEGWFNFVKGIMSIYDMDNFRAACTKAKQIIVSRHDRKDSMELWSHRIIKAEPKTSLEELKEQLKAAKDAFHKASETAQSAYISIGRAEFALNIKQCELKTAEANMDKAIEEGVFATIRRCDSMRAMEELEKTLAEAK
jgi:hypothetical protein